MNISIDQFLIEVDFVAKETTFQQNNNRQLFGIDKRRLQLTAISPLFSVNYPQTFLILI